VPDVYEEPRHTVDFAATQRFGQASIKLSLQNLLDHDELYQQVVGGRDFVTGRYETGRSISLAISYGS
jgi:hypothetical protein